MTNFAGSKVIKKRPVSILVRAAVPLIKNEGENGKQYKKNMSVVFFCLIFSKVFLYLL